MDIEILTSMLLFLAGAVLTYVAAREIEKLKRRALEDIQKKKHTLRNTFLEAREHYKASLREQKSLEQRIESLQRELAEGTEQEDGISLTPEDWLLKNRHLSLEQGQKARELCVKSKNAIDFLGACTILGFISSQISSEAAKVVRRNQQTVAGQ